MQTNEAFRKQLKKLFRSQNLAALSTQSQSQPYASLVAFYAADNLECLYFMTPKTTRKFANLVANKKVALLINSSANQPADFHQAISVTALGEADEVLGAEKESIVSHYLAKHPHLEEFARAPTCALVRVSIESYYMVKNFQNVTELHLEP
jgi:uncharacterized protein YhbP (UPF0306 family)